VTKQPQPQPALDAHATPRADALLLPGESLVPSRRAFLQAAGFGLATATLSGCSRGPTRHVIPYLTGQAGVVSGRAYIMATTCHGCSAACGVLARCRDGRPIKLEGSPEHALSRGGLCATGQAEVLSLYDSKRLAMPLKGTDPIDSQTLDAELRQRLAALRASGGRVRLLTGTINSPSTRAAISRFVAGQPGARHVAYDALSVSALLDAHERTHGVRALPSFHFERAEVIVSFGADFLGTWISPVSFAADYARGRRPDVADGTPAGMSRHIQLEARLSLTGSVADRRATLAPWETIPTLRALCAALEHKAGAHSVLGVVAPTHAAEELTDELWAARGKALIVCGANDMEAQVLTAYANHLLDGYGETLSLARPSRQRTGDDAALATLQRELDADEVELLIVSGVNPAYDLPAFAASIARAGTVVVHAAENTETVQLAQLTAPAPHFLEAWDDAEPEVGRFSLTQPAIPSIRAARTLRHMLAAWAGDGRDDSTLLADHWRESLHARLAPGVDFETFFTRAKHDGYIEEAMVATTEPGFRLDSVRTADAAVGDNKTGPAEGTLRLVLYPKVGLLDGGNAHNPWLQELPDPVTKVTWDNYACFSESRARALDIETGTVVRLTDGEVTLVLPALVQRGQHDDVVAVALGYGRAGTDRFAGVGPDWWEGERTVEEGETIGVNAAPMLSFAGRALSYEHTDVRVEPLGESVQLACTQEHHSLEVPAHLAPEGGQVRDAVALASFASYTDDPEHALHRHHLPDADLWPEDHAPPRHHWGMAIDLTSCIGCSACTVSCQAENNVPVVGKDEVRRHREMHWLRIDRYYDTGRDEDSGDVGASYQPMLCQQCDNAPCESVCPVLATVHSSEGLNQQIYNRCVGTRYCANTCPYKVRRFNWFNYPHEDRLQNHSLNPDVTVRTRGVMEKCSFCVQRIQEAKFEATRRGVELADGDIQVACQQSCPTRAIAFGDLADPNSEVSRLAARQRSYRVLEELNVKPSVRYLARIRNVTDEKGGHAG